MSSFRTAPPRIKRMMKNPRSPVVLVVVAGLIAFSAAAALGARTTGERFADAAFGKLGGDPDEVLDAIGDKVVAKLTGKGGTIDATQAQLIAELAITAGKKLDEVDAEQLVKDIRGDVVEAGLGKLDGVSVDQIVSQVTTALIAQAEGLLADVDVEARASAAIRDMIESLHLENLVKEKIDSIDAEKLAREAIAEQFGGSSSDPVGELVRGVLGG